MWPPGQQFYSPALTRLTSLKGRERKRYPEVTVKLLYYGLKNQLKLFNLTTEKTAENKEKQVPKLKIFLLSFQQIIHLKPE